MTEGFHFDVQGIIDAAEETHASMIVLCSPNNPTGSSLTRDEVESIIRSTTGLVVLDEAYMHFAGESCVDLLHEYERLVVLQTFSKALGAASLRLGYALAAPGMTAQLNKVKLPYSVNSFSLIAVEKLIERWEVVRPWIGRIVTERERVRSALGQISSLRVYPSQANFLLIETLEQTPGELFELLLKRGILIRDVSSYPGLERAVRITVGTPEENDELLSALREVS
jgi:histidinol-phosphate aminotransferase